MNTATVAIETEIALPPRAKALAYAGLVPLVLGTALVWLIGGQDPEAHKFVCFALSAYAGLVLSFLGGIYWGLAFRQADAAPALYAWGILPVVVGWIGVLMLPYAGLALQGAMLIVCYLMDRRFYPRLGAESWLTLRFRMSAISALLCFLAAAGC